MNENQKTLLRIGKHIFFILVLLAWVISSIVDLRRSSSEVHQGYLLIYAVVLMITLLLIHRILTLFGRMQ